VKVPVISGFELVVVEGEGKGTIKPLEYKHITLGRYEPADDDDPDVVTFPDPTVSRVHAVLAWDERRGRYILEHRSRTNATVVNGTELTRPHVLEEGDLLKMGSLVLAVRRAEIDPLSADMQAAERFIVVLSGPDKGKICPLSHSRMALHVPEDAGPDRPWVIVSGVLEWNVEFVQQDERLYVECMERPGIVTAWPGLVYDRLAGARERLELRDGSVLMCGDVGLFPTGRERVREIAAKVRAGEPTGERLADGVKAGKPPYWPGEAPFIIRVLNGSDRGSTLWIDPPALHGPVLIGRSGNAGLHVEIPEREAAELTITFGDDGIRIRNTDARYTANFNWDILRPGDELEMVSGDRITMGRTMLSFEHVATQARLEAYALYHGDTEMPLIRAINHVGYRPENELRIDDRRLAPRHGYIGIRGEQFFYRHLNPDNEAVVGADSVAMGEEHGLEPGDRILLSEGIEVRLDDRISTHRPSDPILIGPSQKQIEDEMAARRSASASAFPEEDEDE
jgi:pSer/pThr/pTyr-binding forkhead associated (FHA) protein